MLDEGGQLLVMGRSVTQWPGVFIPPVPPGTKRWESHTNFAKLRFADFIPCFRMDVVSCGVLLTPINAHVSRCAAVVNSDLHMKAMPTGTFRVAPASRAVDVDVLSALLNFFARHIACRTFEELRSQVSQHERTSVSV